MRDVPHRLFMAWMAHLEAQWNEPTLTDYYLMQVAQAARQAGAKEPNKIKLDWFRLNWSTRRAVPQQTKIEMSMGAWAGITGIKPTFPEQ